MNRKQQVVLSGLLCGIVAVSGCKSGFSNAIPRPKGEIEMRRPEALSAEIVLEPATSALSKAGVDVTVRYASPEELDKFFEKEEVFGKLAGKNPYPEETLVFYVKVSNHSGKKIKVNPEDFVLIDNINKHLNKWEQIRAFRFILSPLTVESGELTPSMKIRRDVVAQKYKALIDEMYPEEIKI